MSSELAILLPAAATLGLVHTLLGPDHYLPFVALGRSRRWSLRKTLWVTLGCGAGHVAGSVVLGLAGIALGWSLFRLEDLEAVRGDLAAWLLLGFGVAYTAWGIRAALRRRPHSHWHRHADGTAHRHPHVHTAAHAHPHDAPGRRGLAPWSLFIVFVLGPCEPLIPMLLYPASQGGWQSVALVAVVFGVTTLAAMTAVVAALSLGLGRARGATLERWAHAAAGATIVACALAIQAGL